jgi:glycosyltransferase involved in cell wall biosynthesis
MVPAPIDGAYTTVMSWRIDNFGVTGKGADILRLIGVPAHSGRRVRLAIAGQAPTDALGQLNRNGWETTDAVTASIDADAYRRFIQASRAELGFAKSMYVETRSGWFSDRTQCYLASGRPAIVRDTGFGTAIPTGEGLFTFDDEGDVVRAMAAVEDDYDRHARAARAIAEEHFAAEKVVRRLLDQAEIE